MQARQHENRGAQMAALRRLVEEKFPQAQPAAPVRRLRTGCPFLDQKGGLRRGALTEICGSPAGGQIALSALLDAARQEGSLTALIDAADAFAPSEWSEALLHRLLWVRCRQADLALKAADYLLRDGNLPLLVLDLQLAPERQLRRIPLSTWHRFHRVIESSATVFVLLTPHPMVEGVAARMALHTQPELLDMYRSRADLVRELNGNIFERGDAQDFTLLEKSA